MAFLAPENRETDILYPYRYDLWDILSFMLLGIAFFKWNILSAKKSYLFYGIMSLIGYLIGICVNCYETNLIMDSNYSILSYSKASITYDVGRIGISLGHIGLIMLFCKMTILKWLKQSLAAVGRMALTNYVMHSIICMIIFTGVGFGMFGKLQRVELLYVVFSIWIFQLIASPIWLRYYNYGPLEWLWRNLSYLKKHQFKKIEK